ncbi:hypothetical protein IQ235_00890 [Oscillatoriales cyanobacterium LEGE 11467]|uniref:Uncharacterized protein n=1 Tax=Zarconia navalis LEGE 11467 TaxID=1828826 RepID=A0A928VSJ8_9CYAN|nr:hypothetical protein [Zarconia navalis]MBE9039351.1 hypothetical protein [Zarconia navalis LEGE 11467]
MFLIDIHDISTIMTQATIERKFYPLPNHELTSLVNLIFHYQQTVSFEMVGVEA